MFPEHLPRSCPHARPTRTRREFLRDGFCGFGGLALAAMLNEEQARAGAVNPLAPKPPASSGPARVGDLPVHGRRSQPPGDVRPQAAAEPAARADAARRSSARRSISSSPATPSCWARGGRSASTAQSGIEVSDLFPHTVDLRRRPRRDPVVPRRHGGPLGRPVRAVHRPGHARASRAWARGSATAWAPRASRCRPTS